MIKNKIDKIAEYLMEATTDELCQIMDAIPYALNEHLCSLLESRISVYDTWDEVAKAYSEDD